MVKCKVIEEFNLSRFNELKNINRVDKDTTGHLYVGDTFECSESLADYLLGNNSLNKKVVETFKEEEKVEGKIEYSVEKPLKVEFKKSNKKKGKK